MGRSGQVNLDILLWIQLSKTMILVFQEASAAQILDLLSQDVELSQQLGLITYKHKMKKGQ